MVPGATPLIRCVLRNGALLPATWTRDCRAAKAEHREWGCAGQTRTLWTEGMEAGGFIQAFGWNQPDPRGTGRAGLRGRRSRGDQGLSKGLLEFWAITGRRRGACGLTGQKPRVAILIGLILSCPRGFQMNVYLDEDELAMYTASRSQKVAFRPEGQLCEGRGSGQTKKESQTRRRQSTLFVQRFCPALKFQAGGEGMHQ